ncbi:MAG: hypothetical protein PHF68_03760 [Candidatus ainarchaeum sp.]|nr:hypothetical protein [Candidatus ainarchaeum sp.]
MVVLDVLFAITIMILAFLLLFKFSETEIYRSNSQRPIDKLNRVGDLSYSLLFNSPNACLVTDSENSFYLLGTINTTKTLTKEMLAIPSDYNCNVTGLTVTGCSSVDPLSGDIYVRNFEIATCTTDLSKKEYLTCITSNSCLKISNTSGTLKIWKGN